MYNAEVKRGSFRGGRFNRGFRGGYRSHYKEEDKDEYFVPQEDSKWSKYKTQWCYSANKGGTCPKGDACFYAHSFNELREPDTPILLSIKKKVEKASYSSKCNKIHLTKEMEDEYKSVQSKCEEQKAKIAELNKENDDLVIENNIHIIIIHYKKILYISL